MAKFKINDLITNGKETLWVVYVNDKSYTITDPNEYCYDMSIEETDKNYRLWQSPTIWHEPTEKHHFEFGITKQILFQTLKGETFIGWAEDGCLGICYVSENEYLEAKYIKRWCYWKDALEVLDKN